ncbi:DUF58 domain-containing protein [Candidatus Bipolaricaulota bacterium]|nr:DUF58 domain-containing protein [Candidatus Bipolaricaulota bacterium]
MGEHGGDVMDPLIDEGFLRRLSRLRFITKGRRASSLSGAHPSPRAGVSLEFADYREYTPGDDFRYIDWNIVGRLDRVLVKTFVHEVDLPIYLLVDLSASMHLGSVPKVRYAARLAAALAYLGLRNLDRVGLYPFTDHLLPSVSPRHGMQQMSRILRALRDVSASGTTSLDLVLREFSHRTHETGLLFLISDFLVGGQYQEGVARLAYRGDEIVAIQIVDREEINPTVTGGVRLVDVETGRRLDLIVGERTLAQYRGRFDSHLKTLQRYLSSQRIPHILAPTDLALEELIHVRLRAQGIVQ